MAWLLKDNTELTKFMVEGEGNYPFVYLDSRGFPTYGIGHLIFRTDKGDAHNELDIFLNLCSSLSVVFKKDQGKGAKATNEEIKAEVRGLLDIGGKKVTEFEARRDEAQGTYILSSAEAFLSVVPAAKKQAAKQADVDFAAYQKAEEKAKRKYMNMGAKGFWSDKASLHTDKAHPLLVLQNDIENVVIQPLKTGGPWSQKVGDLPVPIQMIVFDIVFNMGYTNWTQLAWCKKVRDKIDKEDYEGLAKVILDNVSEKGGNTSERARKRAIKARQYAAQRANDRNLIDQGLGPRTMLA
jgi:GH24 family phage-related lysozyme (muramidase)